MWKASIGVKPIPPPKPAADDDDDWDTDPNFVNNITEKESRWGAKTVEGSGHQDSLRLDELRDAVLKSDVKVKMSLNSQPKPSAGYGGKFGIETDRVDKCAAGYDYKSRVEPHASQRDYSKGFGGQFGVETDRQDGSAVGWADREALAKHDSQRDYAVGFGGKHGIQSDRKDKSAVGWDHHEKLQQHESQKDYKKGFGGQYGVQSDRKDKSAVGWDDHEKLQQHESQIVNKTVERSASVTAAANWQARHGLEKHESQKPAAAVPAERGEVMSSLRSKFEQLAAGGGASEDAKVREERERRRREDEQQRQRQADSERQRQQKIDAEWAASAPEDDAVQQQTVDVPSKARPSIGVRLPYSTKTEETAPPKPVRTPEHVGMETGGDKSPAVPPTPPPTAEATVAAALPPSLSVLLPHCRPSTDDEAANDDGEWEDVDTAPAVVQPAQPQVEQPQPQHDHLPKVEVVASSPLQTQPQVEQPPQLHSQPASSLTAVALFDYERQDDDEIGFDVDDIITDIEQIDAGWWRGTCHGRFGLFPANYVQLR